MSAAVTKIKPELSSLDAPAFLADKPIWLMWRFEHIEGEAKPRKVPYYVNGVKRYGVQGRPEDRQQLTTFIAARSAAARRNMDGIGHACLDGEFTVIDFDNCAPGGKLHPDIEAMAANTYAEYSPSGEGIHLYALGNLNGSNAKSHATAAQFGVELFSTSGYTTFTGNVLEISEGVAELTGEPPSVCKASPELVALVRSRFGNGSSEIALSDKAPLGLSDATIQEALSVLDPDMDYSEWLRAGMALHHETNGQGFALWDKWSAGGKKYPGTEALQSRWDSFGKSQGNAVTLRSLIQLANQNGAHIMLNAVSLEEFDDLDAALVKATSDSKQPKGLVYDFEPFDLFKEQVSIPYLIKGVLPKATLGVLFGESGSGKSFITLDMCFAIARGEPWRGQRTTKGRVAYIIAEGAAGFQNRGRAYAAHHQLTRDDVTIDVLRAAPNLSDYKHTEAIISGLLRSGPPPSLVVVDTLAQCTAGNNENSSEDMGKVIAHCQGIHKSTGAMVLLIHHAGKDSSKGARGWSGIRAAVDVELEVTRTSTGRSIKTTKQKDGADFQEWGFDLAIVDLGEDEEGDTITSCVCVEAAVPVKTKVKVPGANEKPIIDVMDIDGFSGIERKKVLELAMLKFPGVKDEKAKRNNLNRALNRLCEGKNARYLLTEDDKLEFLYSEDDE